MCISYDVAGVGSSDSVVHKHVLVVDVDNDELVQSRNKPKEERRAQLMTTLDILLRDLLSTNMLVIPQEIE